MTFVTSDPKVKNGKPYFAGTNVSIENVLNDIRCGAKFSSIKKRYRELDYKHVNLAFELAHKEGIV